MYEKYEYIKQEVQVNYSNTTLINNNSSNYNNNNNANNNKNNNNNNNNNDNNNNNHNNNNSNNSDWCECSEQGGTQISKALAKATRSTKKTYLLSLC